MEEVGFWEGIRETVSGRGQLRLIIQPTIAIILGIRMGIADAKTGHDPFLMRMILKGEHRGEVAKEALMKVVIPFTLAIVLDGVLQYLTLGYVRPLAAIVMGIVLIALPFTAARGFTNRIYRRAHRQAPA